MEKIEFMQGVHLLQNNYNKKFTNEQLQLYYENLKDMDKDSFLNNIKYAIKTSPYIPNIAQIRNESAKSFMNYPQRNYSNVDLNQFYANTSRRINEKFM